MLEQRIAQMEERSAARPSSTTRISTPSVVRVGVKVHVKDQKTGDSRKFQLVGSAEANPAEDKLSHESPDRQGADGPASAARSSTSRSPAARQGAQDHQDRGRLRTDRYVRPRMGGLRNNRLQSRCRSISSTSRIRPSFSPQRRCVPIERKPNDSWIAMLAGFGSAIRASSTCTASMARARSMSAASSSVADTRLPRHSTST